MLKNKKEREQYITDLSNYALGLDTGMIREWFLKQPLNNGKEIVRIQIKMVSTVFDSKTFEPREEAKFKDHYFIVTDLGYERALRETTVAKLVEMIKEIKE